MSPGEHNMALIYGGKLIHGSPMTTEDLSYANQIYGPEMNSLKDSTAKRNTPIVQVKMATILPSPITLYSNLACSANIIFSNNLPFLAAVSLNIRYCYIARLLNCQVPTILKVCKILSNIYATRGFLIQAMKMDPKFNPLHQILEKM